MIIANSAIKRNGVYLKKGDEVKDLDERELKTLLASGAVIDSAVVAPVVSVAAAPHKLDPDPLGDEDYSGFVPKVTMSKDRLRGFALHLGMEVDKTTPRTDIFNMIKAAHPEVFVVKEPKEEKVEATEPSPEAVEAVASEPVVASEDAPVVSTAAPPLPPVKEAPIDDPDLA